MEFAIGDYVIVRTYSAGVHAGFLKEKDGNEVILTNARRLFYWHAKSGISLSAVAVNGLKEDDSKVCEPLDSIWLEAIEIIPVTNKEVVDQLRETRIAQAE